MDSDKLLRDIGLDLDTFQAHIKRMRKHGKLHKLDVDLLQEKTKKLYDRLLNLEESLNPKEIVVEKKVETQPESAPVVEKPVKTEVKKKVAVEVEIPVEPPKATMPKPEPIPDPKPVLEKPEAAVPVMKEIEQEPVADKIEPEKTVAVEEVSQEEELPDIPTSPQPAVESQPDMASKPQSAFDLFTTSASETIGDKLVENENASIADRMQKTSVADLKQAIGINEKFLFINELFGGNLGKYNKSIEEFNALQSKEGVGAHLVELKVQNQWDEKNDAFQKLKALLERKFG